MLASNSLETPVVGLIASNDAAGFELGTLRKRLAIFASSQRLMEMGIEDEFALLGGFAAGPRALRAFAEDAPLNTDDRPIVAYRAPRVTYSPDSLPSDRLIQLLTTISVDPADVVSGAADETLRRRLAAYWAARNRFIESGRDVRPSSDVGAMLAQVREPLLSVLHISADFRPAYDPLVRMAAALARTDAAGAYRLLDELAQIQPARSEAREVLRRVGAQGISE